MQSRQTIRIASLALSLLLTLAMLGGIDQLAQSAPESAPQWAQNAAPRA